MNIAAGLRLLLALIIVVPLTTCAPPRDTREFVGELGTAGPNVYVNNAAAQNGTWIYKGDSVTTGPDSSALIVFMSGGYFQLDANTDPFFSWETVEGTRCILVKIFRGQGYVQGGPTCIVSPVSDAVARSAVNMVVSERSSVFTLLDGSLTVSRPARAVLLPGQEVRVDPGSPVPRIRTLPPREADARIQWRYQYRFIGWCGPPGQAIQTPVDQCSNQFSFSQPNAAAPRPSVRFGVPLVPFIGGDGGRAGGRSGGGRRPGVE